MAELPEAPTPTLTAIYADYEARQGDGFPRRNIHIVDIVIAVAGSFGSARGRIGPREGSEIDAGATHATLLV